MAGGLEVNVLKEEEDEQTIANLNSLKYLSIRDVVDCQMDIADMSNLHIKGIVSTAYQTFDGAKTSKQKSSSYKMLLLIKKDTSLFDNINVFLKGASIDKCNGLKAKDTIIIKGFHLEKSSVNGHPFQIVSNSDKYHVKIWTIPAKEQAMQIEIKECSSDSKQSSSPSTSTNPGIPCLNFYSSSSEDEKQKPTKRRSTKMDKQPTIVTFGGKRLHLTVSPPKRPVYTKLAELQTCKLGSAVNIFAVVAYVEFGRRIDPLALLTLVDPSSDIRFKVNVFAKTRQQLPVVHCAGDILRIHDVKLSKNHSGDVILGKCSSSGLNWLMFDGHKDAPTSPMAASSSNYSLDEQDHAQVKSLRSWLSNKPAIDPACITKTISDIDPAVTNYFNLPCQVVATCPGNTLNCLILSVWDGTTPKSRCTDLIEEKKDSYVTDAVLKKASDGHAMNIYLYDDHANGVAAALKPGDFVLLANLHVKRATQQSSDKGEAAVYMHKGQTYGRGVYRLEGNWSTFYVEKVKGNIKTLQEARLQTRDLQEHSSPGGPLLTSGNRTTSRAQQTSCTITNHPLIPFTSLHKVVNCEKIPNKFRCRVKAMMFLPTNVKDFVQMCCYSCMKMFPVNQEADCGKRTEYDKENIGTSTSRGMGGNIERRVSVSSGDYGKQQGDSSDNISCTDNLESHKDLQICHSCNKTLTMVYLFSLVIEDETGMLHAMVFDEDARYFFPDLPAPEVFLEDKNVQEAIEQSLVFMTQNPQSEICANSQQDSIVSHFVRDCNESDQSSGSVRHR